MSTLSTVVTSISSALSSQLSITTRFASDYVVGLETMNASVASQSQTMYRIRSQYQQAEEGSNITWKAAAVEIEIAHRLSDVFNERAYTEGAMLTQQATLLDSSFWRALGGVYGLPTGGGPNIELDVEIKGRVVRWSVLCTFLITP